MMNKKQIQAKVREFLTAGTTKAEVFSQLSGHGVKDSQLAYFIASHPDARRCEEHERKLNVLVTIMFIQALVGFLVGFGAGAVIGPSARWIVGALVALIPLLFAWGFFKHHVGAYNAYILLTLIQLPKAFNGFPSSPGATAIVFVINVGVLAYVWYVRQKVFPGFGFMTPKKVKGEYVFSG